MVIANTNVEVDIVNSAAKQSATKAWLPIIFAEYEEPLLVISADNAVNGWLSLIGEELYSIASVEDIFVSIEDNDVDVWVVIPERDLTILHQIVEREGELFDTLVSGENPPFLIDFHVIYRCGRNIEELAPTEAIRLPKQG